MKAILTLVFFFFSFLIFGQEAQPVDKVGAFIGEWYWVVGGVLLLVEYLIGISKLKSNSTIELILSVLRMLNPKK